jgi:CubicO group peptidase (beta-lactamase class C family)
MDAAEFLALYKDVPFDFEPGTAYSLDTTGYVLLGRIVERVSGEALPEYLKHQLFAPIGLSNTSVCPTDARPVGYAADCKEIQDTRDLDVPMPASPYAGDQSLCSTALDLAMWMHAVYDQHAFGDPLTQALSTSARFANGEATGASYAMTLGNLGDSAWVAHSGGVGGFRVAVAHYARLHTSVVVLANCASAKVEAFEHEIACHLLGLPSPSTREPKLAAQEIAAFVGNYQIATTRVRISTNAGKLFFEWPTGAPVELRYRGAMTFVFVGESDTKLVFRVEEGKVVSFELTRAGSVSTGRRME